MRAPVERLRDMREAIEDIERYASLGRDAYDADELIRSWMVHHLAIIGEAATQLGRDFHSSHPGLPWAQMVGMRNILVHGYFGVDVDEVWNAVVRDVPALKDGIARLLRQLEKD